MTDELRQAHKDYRDFVKVWESLGYPDNAKERVMWLERRIIELGGEI